MKVNLIVSVASLLITSAAFAGPVYRCQPTDSDLAILKVFIQSDEKVEFATVVDGKLVPKTSVTRNDNHSTPAGYTGFFAVGGCNQNGSGPHCFAIWTNTLFLSDSMLSNSEQGSAILNGENYDCQLVS